MKGSDRGGSQSLGLKVKGSDRVEARGMGLRVKGSDRGGEASSVSLLEEVNPFFLFSF